MTKCFLGGRADNSIHGQASEERACVLLKQLDSSFSILTEIAVNSTRIIGEIVQSSLDIFNVRAMHQAPGDVSQRARSEIEHRRAAIFLVKILVFATTGFTTTAGSIVVDMDKQRIPVTGRTAAATDFIVLIGVMRTDVDTAIRADVTGYDNCMGSLSVRLCARVCF